MKSFCSFFVQGIALLFFLALAACSPDSGSSSDGASKVKSKKMGNNTIVLHDLADADGLNPLTSSSANGFYIQSNIFQNLIGIDFETLQPYGQLAKDRPTIEEVTEGEYTGGMKLTYEIHPDATWDNGAPITAADYVFTIKAVKNPKTSCGSLRPYIEFIDDIQIDPANPKKFVIFSKEKYILAEEFSGTTVLPEYVYDPNGIMRKFTIKELNDKKNAAQLMKDPDIDKFATQFNSPKYAREKGSVVGSGPYELQEWATGQYVILNRKKTWWGDKVGGKLVANPEKITYKIVNDWTTAVTALKGEDLDVAHGIRPNDFLDLKKNTQFTQLFNIHTPDELSYVYLGLNRKNPRLADAKVRKALAHLIDKTEIIENLLYGMGKPVTGPISPFKPYYNNSITPVEYNVDKAKQLLAEAGWTDTDGNGIVDKVVNGEKLEMKLEFKYNSGNDTRKNIGILLKENAKRAGVEVNVIAREWTVFLEDTKKRDYDIFCGGWIQSPILDDPKQIWHTGSDHPDGDNRVGFGNAESDKIIDEIRITLDETKRNQLYLRFQELVAADQPYIFLYSPQNRLAIHARFDNANPSLNRPGFNEKAFTIKQGWMAAQ